MAQIDFATYDNLENKIIYLSPGQYIKFLFGNFEIWRKKITSEIVGHTPESRVLFKHLVSIGHIDDYDTFVHTFFSSHSSQSCNDSELLNQSVKSWFQLNPFHAKKEEYRLIFNFRDRLDEQLTDTKIFSEKKFNAVETNRESAALLNKKLRLSLKRIVQRRLLLEAQRQLVFSDKSVKQVAGQLGYDDPAYFNRFFSLKYNASPLEFRKTFNYSMPDSFVQNLEELIRQYHKTEHSVSFYAGKLHMSIQTLARKTNEKFSTSVGRLIRRELFSSAKTLLQQGMPVHEAAWELGFKEPNHFSAFFKSVSGITPTAFIL